jgi:F0F1-type ATP synthase alpha subunit
MAVATTEELYQRLLRSIREGVDLQPKMVNVGTVIQVGDGVARISGLEQAMASELLEFPPKAGRSEPVYGIALNLEKDWVSAIILGDYLGIEEGDQVNSTGRVISVPVGQALIGRVVNALGQPVDGKGPIQTTTYRPIERIAPGVITRKSVDTPVQTGIIAIDSMIPIGRGQRELIIGDRQTGKTAVAIDTIINQKGQGMVCIYVAIGQKRAQVAQIINILENGQIYLETDLFNAGIRPALNVGISVSRVGGAAQTRAMRSVSDRLKIDMAQFRDLAAFAQFASDLDATTRAQIERGQRLQEVLKQPQFQPMPLEEQVVILFAGINGYLDDVPINQIGRFKAELFTYMRTAHPEVGKMIYDNRLDRKFPSPEIRSAIENMLKEFKQMSDFSAEQA